MSFASSLRLAAPLVLLTPLLADADWQSGGPEAGSITALAVDPSTPSTLYAGAGCGGVYKTVNGAVLRRTCWCESRPFTEKMDQVRQQAESRMLRRARLPRVLRWL